MNRDRRDGRVPTIVAIAAAGLLTREWLRRRQADLHGQVALVTGGSRGLGLLLARELADQGCRLALCARDADELARAADDLRRRGAEVLTVVCDVGDQAQVDRLVHTTLERYGQVDLLVNNAGVIQVGPLSAMRVEDFREAQDVMYWGLVYPTLAVLPGMRTRGQGRILNVTSIGGRVPVPHLLPYCGAKFGAVGFSRGLRAELARDGISVTTIVPGLMRTGSVFNAYFKGDRPTEFALFGALASVPPFSMDAERAARQIVQALRRGEAERVLSFPAVLLAEAHGLAPGLTTNLMGLVNRLLPPNRPGGQERERGREIQARLDARWLDRLLSWSSSAARRFNQEHATTAAAGARRA